MEYLKKENLTQNKSMVFDGTSRKGNGLLMGLWMVPYSIHIEVCTKKYKRNLIKLLPKYNYKLFLCE